MPLISIPTLKEYQRPVIDLYGVEALLDTGAFLPVVSLPAKVVEKVFSAEKILPDQHIGGIGGETSGDVYRLSDFKIGDIVYSPFDVFVPHKSRLSFPILLSATLFNGTSYTVDTEKMQLIVDTKNTSLRREFKLITLKGKLYPQIDGVLIQDTSLFLNDALLGVFS